MRGTYVSEQPTLASLGKRFWITRGVALALFVLLGAVVSRGRPANGFYYADWSELSRALVAGLGIALAALLAIGTLGYGLRRWKGMHTSWSDAVFGLPVIVVTLILLVFSSGFRFALHESAVTRASADPRGTSAEREQAKRRVVAFIAAMQPAIKENLAAADDLRLWASLPSPNSPRGRALVRDARDHLTNQLVDVRQLPDYQLRDLARTRTLLIEAVLKGRNAVELYRAALEGNRRRGIPLERDAQSMALLRRGDDMMALAERDRQRLHVLGEQLNAKYGFK